MEQAFEQATEALSVGEVPVGCVFFKDSQIISQGRNRVNETKNATKHAEVVAVEELAAAIRRQGPTLTPDEAYEELRRTLHGSELFVTVEPCIMCAGLLRYFNIRKVTFGCGNDRFGGNGSVLSVHDALSDILVPYEVSGGHEAHRAMNLLKLFYEQENINAPQEKRKKKEKDVKDDKV